MVNISIYLSQPPKRCRKLFPEWHSDDLFPIFFQGFQRFYRFGGCSTSFFGIWLSPRCKMSTQILLVANEDHPTSLADSKGSSKPVINGLWVKQCHFSSPKSPKSPHQGRCVRGLIPWIQEPGGSQVGRVLGTFIVQFRAYEAGTGPGDPKKNAPGRTQMDGS